MIWICSISGKISSSESARRICWLMRRSTWVPERASVGCIHWFITSFNRRSSATCGCTRGRWPVSTYRTSLTRAWRSFSSNSKITNALVLAAIHRLLSTAATAERFYAWNVSLTSTTTIQWLSKSTRFLPSALVHLRFDLLCKSLAQINHFDVNSQN